MDKTHFRFQIKWRARRDYVGLSSAIAPALLYLLLPCSRVAHGPGTKPPPQRWKRPGKANRLIQEVIDFQDVTHVAEGVLCL